MTIHDVLTRPEWGASANVVWGVYSICWAGIAQYLLRKHSDTLNPDAKNLLVYLRVTCLSVLGMCVFFTIARWTAPEGEHYNPTLITYGGFVMMVCVTALCWAGFHACYPFLRGPLHHWTPRLLFPLLLAIALIGAWM